MSILKDVFVKKREDHEFIRVLIDENLNFE